MILEALVWVAVGYSLQGFIDAARSIRRPLKGI